MLLTIERVALLKRVSLFGRTPDRVLAGIARTLEEETFLAGTTMISEGAVEDWLFLLIGGVGFVVLGQVILSEARNRAG